ncbi:MBL fold metallo-hydrolase [Lachnospiraceae bacterium OttesenSCG-928-D06]|nr:MBL fold metallo-hydrolase [Lachnospiraceae bacterium OttesenSCG-928-D06]
MASKRYTVHPIDQNTFAIEEKTRLSQGLCYLLLGEEKALLIDTGLGYNELADTVKGLTHLPVIVANTHAHLDHIGGNYLFHELWYHEADRPIFALHTNLDYTLRLFTEGMPWLMVGIMKKIAKRMIHIDSSGHYQYFNDHHIFHLGTRDVEVVPTPGHTPGSVCFLDRNSRMLFSGDTLCEWGILLHIPNEGCPPTMFLNSMQRLKSLAECYDTIWPGHHGFPVEKSYIDDYLVCAEQIINKTAHYSITKSRHCAQYGKVLITIPDKEVVERG